MLRRSSSLVFVSSVAVLPLTASHWMSAVTSAAMALASWELKAALKLRTVRSRALTAAGSGAAALGGAAAGTAGAAGAAAVFGGAAGAGAGAGADDRPGKRGNEEQDVASSSASTKRNRSGLMVIFPPLSTMIP